MARWRWLWRHGCLLGRLLLRWPLGCNLPKRPAALVVGSGPPQAVNPFGLNVKALIGCLGQLALKRDQVPIL